MTSATLFREGPDLDELLAELDAEHDGRVRVVDVAFGRDGGVMGFFAKRTVGVHYVLTDDVQPAPARTAAADESPLEALLRAAEDAEVAAARVPAATSVAPAAAAEAAAMVASGRVDDAAQPAGDNVEFARMLLDIAAEKAAEKAAERRVQPPADLAPAPLVRDDAPPAPPALPTQPAPPAPEYVRFELPAVARLAPPAPALVPARVPAPAPGAPAPDLALTELLARARTRPVGAHRACDATAVVPAAAPVVPPLAVPAAVEIAPPPAAPEAVTFSPAPSRTPLTLRRQLTEMGVPLRWLGSEVGSAFEVIESLIRRVPVAPRVDLGPGELLVVAGPAAQARAEAVRLCTELRLDPARIRTAGCGDDPIRHRRQAAALELEVRGTRGEPCVVVVATDSSGDTGGVADLEWAAEIVAALVPDQLVLVVDATCRVEDVRRTVGVFGRVASLAIVACARAASPAALWELDVPVGSIDGAPASRGRWAALLIDRLADLDGN